MAFPGYIPIDKASGTITMQRREGRKKREDRWFKTRQIIARRCVKHVSI